MSFKHFKYLNVPDSWERYFTKYPQGMSILEALFEWVSQVDNMVDNQNKLNDNVKQFRTEIDEFVGRFDERLQVEVTNTLTDWQNSGFLDVVISEALQWQLDDYITTNEQDKVLLTTQLAQTNQLISERGLDVTLFEEFIPDRTLPRDEWDWSEAIRQSVKSAMNTTVLGREKQIFFPEGIYNVESRFLNNMNLPLSRGIQFRGVGAFSSVFRLITNNTESWFYDNEVGNAEFEMVSFVDLGFFGDNSTYTNFIRLWSQGAEKQFKFYRCQFGRNVSNALGFGYIGLNTFFETRGTGNADLCKFDHCGISGVTGAVWRLNNPQSVVFEVVATDILVIDGGHVVEIGSEGGGSMHFMGGAWHNENSTPTPSYLLNISSGAKQGFGNCEMVFNSIRCEFHGGNAGIVNLSTAEGLTQATFNDCNFGVTQDGATDGIILTGNKRVTFNNCVIHERQKIKILGYTVVRSNSPTLEFNGCLLGDATDDFYKRLTIEAEKFRIIGRNNRQHGSVSVYPYTPLDFDMGWRNFNPRDPAPSVKIAPLMQETDVFQSGSSTIEYRVKLPPYSMLKGVYIKKEAEGGSVEPYQLTVSNDDKTVIYAQSEVTEFRYETLIDEPHINVTLTSDGIVRLYTTQTGVGQLHYGIAYVEYI